jgi:hypothetical protein
MAVRIFGLDIKSYCMICGEECPLDDINTSLFTHTLGDTLLHRINAAYTHHKQEDLCRFPSSSPSITEAPKSPNK